MKYYEKTESFLHYYIAQLRLGELPKLNKSIKHACIIMDIIVNVLKWKSMASGYIALLITCPFTKHQVIAVYLLSAVA